MASRAKILISLIGRKEKTPCHRGHKIGDCYDFDTERGQLCPMAAHVAFPYIDILRYGGQIPSNMKNRAVFSCPDVDTINVFQIDKIEETETERLRLVPLTLKDREIIYSIGSNPEVARYMRFDTLKSLQEAFQLILQLSTGKNKGWIAYEKESGKPAGVIALKGSEEKDVNDVTLFLDQPFWNRHYASELMEWAVKNTEEQTGRKILESYVVKENTACLKMLDHQGFDLIRQWDLPDVSLMILRKQC